MDTAASTATAGTNAAQTNHPLEQEMLDRQRMWNEHDLQGYSAAYAPDATFTGPTTGYQPISIPEHIGLIQQLHTAMPDGRVKIMDITSNGRDRLMQRWIYTGTWRGTFQNGPLAGKAPTGHSMTLSGVTVLEYKDGKIVAETQYFDSLVYLGQLGVTL